MVKVGRKSMKEQGNGFGEDLAGKREIQVLKKVFSTIKTFCKIFAQIMI